jgi:protein-tyrosine phosphatase
MDTRIDPLRFPIEGFAVHGNTPFSMPLISHVAGNLYQGGCIDEVPLPEQIQHVVSLYPWERYRAHDGVVSSLTVKLFDSSDLPDEQLLWAVAAHVHRVCALGPTLVHCQAGLNRSGMISALALILHGRTPREAVDLLRSSRSPAVLCNEAFERFVLSREAPC